MDAKGKISGKGLDLSGLLGVIKSMVLLNVRAIGTMTFFLDIIILSQSPGLLLA